MYKIHIYICIYVFYTKCKITFKMKESNSALEEKAIGKSEDEKFV